MIYLASPYSHPDPAVVEERYVHTLDATALYLRAGHVIYSPIVHCHALAQRHSLPTDAQFWSNYNRGMLRLAESLWILDIDGWKDSVGVNNEASTAIACGIPTKLVNPWRE